MAVEEIGRLRTIALIGQGGTGKTQLADAMLFTAGGFGIWVVIDFIMIVVGGFTDIDGKYVLDWQV